MSELTFRRRTAKVEFNGKDQGRIMSKLRSRLALHKWFWNPACIAALLLGAVIPAIEGATDSTEGSTRIAVFADPAVVKLTAGCADPQRLADLLRTPQREVVFLDAKQLADPKQLSTKAIDLLVLPYGPSFPRAAEDSLKGFLKAGGDFVSVGGYAFDKLYGDEGDLAVELLKAPGMEDEDSATFWSADLDTGGGKSGDASAVSVARVTDDPHSGNHCLQLHVPDSAPGSYYKVCQYVEGLVPGKSYKATGWIRTRDVKDGNVYFAVAFLDASGKRLSFVQDMGTRRSVGTTGWRHFECNFVLPAKTARLRVVGMFSSSGKGTAFFDDFSLKLSDRSLLNTRHGHGSRVIMQFKQDQVPIFDASYRLAGAVACQTSPDQCIVTADCARQGALAGQAAVGMTCFNGPVSSKPRIRWTSLIQSHDGYGRKAGSVLGLSQNFAGIYKHSLWAYAGIENEDLFDGSHPGFAQALKEVVDHMLVGVFLHTPEPEFMTYRPGEPVKARLNVCNSGKQDRKLRVTAEIVMDGATVALQERDIAISAGEDQQLTFAFTGLKEAREVVGVLRYRLYAGDREIDTMQTGFFVPNGDEDKGLPLSFADNFFRVKGKPMMLFGVNQTGVMFSPYYENPLTWSQDYGRCRDFGFNVWRLLHILPDAQMRAIAGNTCEKTPGLDYPSEAMLRRMDAVFMLAQHYDLAPMPCWYDWMPGAGASDDALRQQEVFVRIYGERYGKLAGMLYDVSNEETIGYYDTPDFNRAFRAFLTERYGNDAALRAAWGDDAATIAAATYKKPSGEWHSRKGHDTELFRIQVMERWLASSVGAAREIGDKRPVTTENYASKLPAGDAFGSRRHLTFANMHNYGDWQPGYACFFSRHMQGQGHTIGEFGAKSHPMYKKGHYAYQPLEEAPAYFRRTVFLNVGLGVAGMFVWDVKDLQDSAFYFGMSYHSEQVTKNVGYQFRNLAFFFRRFIPDYEPEELWVVIPDHFLLGGGQDTLQPHFYSLLTAMTRTNVPFSTIRQYNLPRILKDKPKAVMIPLSYILTDADVKTLTTYVERGGRVYLSGDCAFTPDRQETRRHVLADLAGVEPLSRRFPDIRCFEGPVVSASATATLPAFNACPTYELRPGSATTVLRWAGSLPLLCEHRIGKGTVAFVNDPIELHLKEDELVPIYADFARRAGLAPLVEMPVDSKLLVFRRRTANRGTLTLVLNDGEEDRTVRVGKVELACPAGTQAAVYRSKRGRISALALPASASIDGRPFRTGGGHVLLTAMDAKDLRSSQAILVLPSPELLGELGLQGIRPSLAAEIGEIVDGQWITYERIADGANLDVSKLRSTALFLLTPPEKAAVWSRQIEEMVLKPEEMDRL